MAPGSTAAEINCPTSATSAAANASGTAATGNLSQRPARTTGHRIANAIPKEPSSVTHILPGNQKAVTREPSASAPRTSAGIGAFRAVQAFCAVKR